MKEESKETNKTLGDGKVEGGKENHKLTGICLTLKFYSPRTRRIQI